MNDKMFDLSKETTEQLKIDLMTCTKNLYLLTTDFYGEVYRYYDLPMSLDAKLLVNALQEEINDITEELNKRNDA